MPYRARLVLTSGDRPALDRIVGRFRDLADRKGASVSGPHTRPTRELDVPLFKRLDGTDRFGTWRYAVYTRELEIVGHESVARAVAAEAEQAAVDISLTVVSADLPESGD